MADTKVYEPLEIKNIYELERCPIINKTDYLLFKLVHSLNVNGKSCYASNSYLTERCGCNTKAIQRSIVKLIKLKLLKRGHNPWGSRRLKTTYLYLKNDKVIENKVDNDLIFDTLTNLTYSDSSDSNKTMDNCDHNADIFCSDTKNFDFNSDLISDNNDLDRVPDVHKYNNIIYNKIDSKLSINKLKDKSFSTTKVENYDTLCYFKNENNKRCNSTSDSDCSCYEKIENEKNNNVCAYENITSSCDEPQSQAKPVVHDVDNDILHHIISTEREQLNFFDDIYNNSVENFKTNEQLNDNNINETVKNDELKPGEGLALNENIIDLTKTENVEENNMEIKKTDIFGISHNTNIDIQNQNQSQNQIKPGLDVETKNAEPCVMSIKIDKNKTGLLKSHIKQNRTTKEQKKNKFVEFCEYAKIIGTSEKLTFSIQRYVKWLLGNRKVDINQWKLTVDNLNNELNSIAMSNIREQAAVEAFDTSYASGYIKLFVDKYKYKPYMNSPQTYNKYKFSLQNNTAFANNYNSQNNSNSDSSNNNYEPDFATDENGNLLTF